VRFEPNRFFTMTFSKSLLNLFQQNVPGQNYTNAALTRAVTLGMLRLRNHHRPLSVLLFVGAIGLGKTYAVQSFARVLFGDENRLISINCQQINQSAEPLSNLYWQLASGYLQSQALKPNTGLSSSIVVFEGVDRASEAFRGFLADALARGRILTPGGFFSLRNSFVILTSTTSRRKTDQITRKTIGFFPDNEADSEMPTQDVVALEEIDNLLGAQLVSQIDEIVVFQNLNEQNVISWLEHQISETESSLAKAGIGFIVEDEAKSFMLRLGLQDLTHGTRRINQVVRNYLDFPLADLLVSGNLLPGMTVLVKFKAPTPFLNFQILIPALTEEGRTLPLSEHR
jgi:ATP-dependent Clp protease ATP-binding subunit ClpA